MDEGRYTDLALQAKGILAKNARGDHTIPSDGPYTHQWLWDSCFIAIGLAHYDIERAKKEVLSLLRGQWSNGMLPNMIFGTSDQHPRDRDLWRSWVSPYAPDEVSTSGITQPPMLAEAIVRIGKKLNKSDRRTWYQTVYPALLKYHEWLYNERDPHHEGVVLQIHPWEVGLDNTPPWTSELQLHHKPWWIKLVDTLKLDRLAFLIRRDTRHHVRIDQRLSNIDALLYYDTTLRLRRKRYDIDSILRRSLFCIEDLTFNCILIRANKHLKDIAKYIGKELPEDISASIEKGENALEQYWDAYTSQYYSREHVTHKLIKVQSIATLMPLYSGVISKERAEQLVRHLYNPQTFGTDYPIPSVPKSSEWFKEHGYWQGPTWMNTNWLIIDGLRRYKFDEIADAVSVSSLEMVLKNGFYEYFSPLDASPAGIENFSWTASLAIDLAITTPGLPGKAVLKSLASAPVLPITSKTELAEDAKPPEQKD